jgi:hypothetical protein
MESTFNKTKLELFEAIDHKGLDSDIDQATTNALSAELPKN